MSVPAVRRLVVGVDGSGESVVALRWACREASLRGAEVHAVHVREAQRVPSYAIPVQSNPSDATVSVDDLVRSVQADQAPDVQVDVELVDGLPARVLLDRCADADMLILGTSSDVPGAMRSAGPVIRDCLRRSPCPVVVISANQDPRLRHEAAARANGARVPLPAGV